MRKRFRPAIFSAVSADVPYVKYSWKCDIAEANHRTYAPSPCNMTKEKLTVLLGVLFVWLSVEDFHGILQI